MKLLKCKICMGEVDLVGNDRSVNRKVKCRKCGFTNEAVESNKGPEIVVIRKRPQL
jgi:hypothetical protein